MAIFLSFKCKKCNKEIHLTMGLLHRDLLSVKEGLELPEGAKLPDEETFKKMSFEKSHEKTGKFADEIINHEKTCGGEMVYTGSGTSC